MFCYFCTLTLSWWRSLLYRNQLTDLLCKSSDWFLYDGGLRNESAKEFVVSEKMSEKAILKIFVYEWLIINGRKTQVDSEYPTFFSVFLYFNILTFNSEMI